MTQTCATTGVSVRMRVGAVGACLAVAGALGTPAAAAAGTTTSVAVAGAATSIAASCRLGWSSGPKALPGGTSATVRNVRAGRHACYDRLVVDLAGSRTKAGYDVRYVPQVYADGSGALVPLRGAAKLAIVVRAPAYDTRGRTTYRPRSRTELVPVGGYQTFRQVSWAGSFEGQTTIGLGVRARLPMRAFVLRTGTRQVLVVDVAHSWAR